MAKILLVEDDKSLREIYGVRLQAEGYTIVSAGDGEEALAIAIKERPDLIVSDVMMPKISGFDMLDILRSTSETKNVKVIMMTALSSDDQRARGESLGADRYLVKSQVGIEDVVRTVHDVLGDGLPSAAPAQTTATTPGVAQMPTPVMDNGASQVAPTPDLASAPTPTPAQVPTPTPIPTPPPAPTPVISMSDPSGSLGSPNIGSTTPPAPVTPPAPALEPAPTPTPAPVTPPNPVLTPPSEPTSAPASTPSPVPMPTSAPASTLPEPTAPFSSPAPASLGERVIQPLTNPLTGGASTPADISAQIEQALGGAPVANTMTPPMPTPDAAPAPSAPEPVPSQPLSGMADPMATPSGVTVSPLTPPTPATPPVPQTLGDIPPVAPAQGVTPPASPVDPLAPPAI